MGGSIRVNGDNVGDGVVDVGVAEGRVAALGGHRALAVQGVFQQRARTLSRARRPRRRVAHLGRVGGTMKVIACIEDPVVIQKILNHLKEKGEYQDAVRLSESRGPPQPNLFG